MTNPVTPHDDPPGLVEEEGVQSTASQGAPAGAGTGPADPEIDAAPEDDALLGPAGGQPQPGQELAAGEG